MAAKPSSAKQSMNEPKSDLAVSYNGFKEYEGQRYTGMKIGRSHKWHYDQGEWKETKITPDSNVMPDAPLGFTAPAVRACKRISRRLSTVARSAKVGCP